MPPPPAQAGKFKPRKPVKKVRPGEASGVVPDAASSASNLTVAFAPSTDNNASRSDRRSSGRDGGGRGDRGGRGRGRGRGRAPIPSGRVFFTGGEKPLSSSAKRKSAVDPSIGKPKSKDQEATEEVVGQLDTAIGSSKDGKAGYFGGNYDEDYEQSNFNEQAEQVGLGVGGFMYDSDSSREEERAKGRTQEYSSIDPLELPFPSQPLPIGIGAAERPHAYESDTPSADRVSSEQAVGTINQHLPEPSLSPFVDSREADKLTWEMNSWFLVQFPTRLPPLQPRAPDGPTAAFSAEDPIDDVNVEDPNQQPTISEVVTPPVAAKTHDNVLTSVAAGRIGKIIVYKSGKTVLKMEGADGRSSILMNVNEGLTCSFLQQVVVIDPDDAKFVALGNVSKSIVVTPDLESALIAD